LSAYESPIHELSYDVLLVSKLQAFSEIWQDDYRSVGTVPRILTCVHALVRARDRLSDLLGHGRFGGSAREARQESSGVVGRPPWEGSAQCIKLLAPRDSQFPTRFPVSIFESNNSATRATIHKRIGVYKSSLLGLSRTSIRL
jgi:hypothetical protein